MFQQMFLIIESGTFSIRYSSASSEETVPLQIYIIAGRVGNYPNYR